MIYELRVYHCVPGRLPDLIKRFDTLTLPLWKKHGIQQDHLLVGKVRRKTCSTNCASTTAFPAAFRIC